MTLMKKITTTASGLSLLLLAVLSLNFIASKINVRFDLTQDKVFSLSEGTRSLLGKLERDVTIKLFFSRSMKDLPVPVKTYATRVEELLHEYADAGKGRITIEVIDPKPDTDDEEWAQKYGITGVRLPKGDQMYFGIVFLIGTQEMAIPYLDPRREEFLEYDIAEALMSKTKKETVSIGLISSLPVIGSPSPVMGPQGPIDDTWAIVNDLRRNFQVSKVETDTKEIPANIKVLMVIHPKEIPEPTLYAIDQFVLNGGKLVVAVDPMSRTDMQMNANAPKTPGQAPRLSSDLEKLLAAWDIEYDKNTLVGDAALATQINAGGQMMRYPFFVTLNESLLSRQSVITGKLKSILVGEGGVISHKSGANSKFESLMNFTKDSGVTNSQSAMYQNPLELARSLKPDGKERSLAAVVTGRFKTAFPAGAPSGASISQKHRAEAERETAIVVVADVDMFYDQNAVDKFRFGPQVMVRPRNDNLSFLVNAMDYLGGSEDLIAIRSKGRIARPFTRVAEIQKEAQKRWQAEEESLTTQINELQRKLNEMQAQRTDGNRFALNAEQQAEINKFREDERRFKKQRREVRKNLRDDIEQLGRGLVAANMLVVPLSAAGLGVSVFYRRSRRFRNTKQGGQR